MREIEFRGLRKDGKGWVYGVPFHIYEEDKCFIIDNCRTSNFKQDETEFTGYEVHPKTVGQYIGKKDMNDELLFEGDMMNPDKSWDEERTVIGWNEDTAGFALFIYGVGVHGQLELQHVLGLDDVDLRMDIKTGNIHEEEGE